MGKNKFRYLAVILCFCLFVLSTTTACVDTSKSKKENTTKEVTTKKETKEETKEEKATTEKETTKAPTTTPKPTTTQAPTTTPLPTTTPAPTTEPPTTLALDMSVIPAYSGSAYIVINGNVPYFTDGDKGRTDAFETYSELDSLGRCGKAYANICKSLMPTEERGEIGSVKPSGWHTVKYEGVDGNYLYNRCHLIGFQLAGENANNKNLITGTRYFNVQGMLPFENMVADYVRETNNNVLYRVSPVFEGNNLVASGVLMEAYSVQDAGAGVMFCVYVYNVQPGIVIDYATGDSYQVETVPQTTVQATTVPPATQSPVVNSASGAQTYILNTNTMKFHYPDCRSVNKMSEHNKQEVFASRDELIAQGYSPCGNCNP